MVIQGCRISAGQVSAGLFNTELPASFNVVVLRPKAETAIYFGYQMGIVTSILSLLSSSHSGLQGMGLILNHRSRKLN
jgi:hypothetical protein